MKSIYKLIAGLFALLILANFLSSLFETSVAVMTGVLFVGVTLCQCASIVPAGVLRGVLTELWTGELLDKFRFKGKWLSMIPRQDNYVNNNAIHLADIGADPDVLINNTSYPILTAQRTDTDIVVALKKFDTTNTEITDDELYGLPYDKPGSALAQHRATLEQKSSQYGLYGMYPATASSDQPIVVTTGADNGLGRKRITLQDIVNAKTAMDNLEVPLEDRVLVLCNDHVNDILLFDQSFRDRFSNTETGMIKNWMGFNVFQDVYNAKYDASNTKKAWGSAAAGTDRNASVFFYAPRAFQAAGTAKMYYAKSENDPENRTSKLGFRLYHIVLPKKTTGFGAIVSDDTI